MKLFKILIPALGLVAAAFTYSSCAKDTPSIAERTVPNYTSTFQVFNSMVKAARNYIYVDGVQVTGAALAYQGVSPATAYAYSVGAGTHTILIKDTAAVTTQAPITFTTTFEVGKDYSIFLYDSIISPKQMTILNDLVNIPKDTTARLRFANFIYNPTAVPAVDVYSFRRGGVGGLGAVPVFSNIATNSVTDFIPYASGITDTLYVYAQGTTSPILAKGFITSLTPQRFYTSAYNGSYRGTAKAVTTFTTY